MTVSVKVYKATFVSIDSEYEITHNITRMCTGVSKTVLFIFYLLFYSVFVSFLSESEHWSVIPVPPLIKVVSKTFKICIV